VDKQKKQGACLETKERDMWALGTTVFEWSAGYSPFAKDTRSEVTDDENVEAAGKGMCSGGGKVNG
jgi:hypothetical protein